MEWIILIVLTLVIGFWASGLAGEMRSSLKTPPPTFIPPKPKAERPQKTASQQKKRDRRDNAWAMFVIAAIIAAASTVFGPIGLIIDFFIFLAVVIFWSAGAIGMVGSIGAGPDPRPKSWPPPPLVATMYECPWCHKKLPPGPGGTTPEYCHIGGPNGGIPQAIAWREK